MLSENADNITSNLAFRKLQLLGRSSIAVVLPKKWVQEIGLKPGDVVLLKLVGKSIVIEPHIQTTVLDSEIKSQEVPKEVEVTSDNVWRALRKIVGLYLSGVTSLIVIFKEDLQGLKHIVKSFIRGKLPGAEIIDEKLNMIFVRFMIDVEEFPLRKIIKRMSNIAVSILRDGLAFLTSNRKFVENEQDVITRDEEIDRLYLLVYRLVNQGLHNSKILQKLEVSDTRELAAALIVAKSIERCGDHATRVAYLAKVITGSLTFKELQPEIIDKLVELGHSICDVLRLATESFVNKDVELAHSILDRRIEIRKLSIQLIDSIVKRACPLSMVCANELITYTVLLVESMRRFLAYGYDIAEITIDTYTR